MIRLLQILALLLAGLAGAPASGAPASGMASQLDALCQAAKDGLTPLSDVEACLQKGSPKGPTEELSEAPSRDADGSNRFREQEEVEDEEENDEDEAGMSTWLFAALRADAVRAGPAAVVHASGLRSGAVRTRGPPPR